MNHVAILSLGVLMTLGLAGATAEPIRVGLFELKPHLFSPDGKAAAGSAVDYLTAVADQTGTALQWEVLPFPRLIDMLYMGELDVGIFVSKNPDREAHLIFADQSFVQGKPVFVVPTRNRLMTVTPAGIQGWTIGYLQGANLSPFLRDNQARVTLELRSPERYLDTMLEKLLDGKIDAIFDLNDVTYPYAARQKGVRDRIKLLYTPDNPTAIFVAASKKSARGQAFLAAYNEVIKKTGLKYGPFLDKYLN